MLKVLGPSVFVVLLCVFVHLAHSVSYKDLEALGIDCPDRFQCRGTRENRPFYKRNCECDSDCQKYQDCCVNINKRSSSQSKALTNVMCLQSGPDAYSGVYVVSKCSRSWTGPTEVKQKCEGSTDFSDPMIAAPVTSTTASVTYKNLHCAQCNNADLNSLKIFNFRLSCKNLRLRNMSEEQFMDQIFYKKEDNAWGINRVDASRKSEFKPCLILFQLPEYLKKSVRFCRSNVISTCNRDWNRKKACKKYMAVVYTRNNAYRNPHCAICNGVTVSQMECVPDTSSSHITLSFTALIDINHKTRKKSCPYDQLYDPYFKMCRKLSCAVKGFVIQNRKCVSGK